MQREKRTYSGNLLEADFYPVFANGRKKPFRDPKKKHSTAAQEKYNHTVAVKKTIRLVNANFDNGDILMHPTYEPSKAPKTYEEAERDVANYLRRIKTKRTSELRRVKLLLAARPDDKGLRARKKKLEAPFKYYYSTETVQYKTGRYAGRQNYHFHIFITGGIPRDMCEDMWKNGMRCNADRFRPETFGPEAAARYISKDAKGNRRIRHSRNLTDPKVKTVDSRITRRGVELLAKRRVDDAEYWEKRYKGYKFVRTFPRYNEYNSSWYLTVIMYRTDTKDIPEWKISEWIDE